MKTNLFNPGDRVQLRSGGPVMIVQKYPLKHSVLFGWYVDDKTVECTWYDTEKGFQKRHFLQRNLVKSPYESSNNMCYHSSRDIVSRQNIKTR